MAEFFLYSFAYSKFREGVWFSHLDTTRILERAVRRARLEVAYTRGFNPHIRLSTPRALPLGVASAGEWFTLRLLRPEAPEPMQDRLNRRLPAGFRIVRVQAGGAPPPEERFRLELRFRGDGVKAEEALEHLLSADRIEVERIRKGKVGRRDVRPFFRGGRREGGRLSFLAAPAGDRLPSPGDLVRALRGIAEDHGLEVEEILVVPPGFEPPGREGGDGAGGVSGWNDHDA